MPDDLYLFLLAATLFAVLPTLLAFSRALDAYSSLSAVAILSSSFKFDLMVLFRLFPASNGR
jgi:hypothetical protein